MLIGSLDTAAVDKLRGTLRGFDLCVLILLYRHLDFAHFHKLKQARLLDQLTDAKNAAVHPANLRRALRQLERLGYLERGPRQDRTYTYRLVFNPVR